MMHDEMMSTNASNGLNTQVSFEATRAGSIHQQIDWWRKPQSSANLAPLWADWGCATSTPCIYQSAPLPPATLSDDPPLDVCPVNGSGWMQHPALAGYRPFANGNIDWAPTWRQCQIRHDETIIDVVLTDAESGLRWQQAWALMAEGRLWKVSTTLQNTGETPYQLSWLASVTLPLPARVSQVLTLGGAWAGEFNEHWDTLPKAMFRRDNRRGRTSHDCFPGAMLGADDLNCDNAEAWGVHLGFSGNHSLLVEPLTDGRRQLQIGEFLQDGERLLSAGETFHAPPAYVAYSAQGLNGLSAAFHEAARALIGEFTPEKIKHQRLRPVHLNTWEALYFDHDASRLTALASAAAKIGVERFVLDDGWFKGRDHDRAGLGDWSPDPKKYPHGLASLAQTVTSLGMEFGLWVEPEMVNPDSDLYRAHPDWVLSLPMRTPVLGRNQLVLNLTRQEVSDALFDKLNTLLSTLPIRYLKWDMNRDLAPAATNGVAVHGEQVRSLYRLLERVRTAHPNVEIETCASGGGRADFGILQYTHRVWTSDCNDALDRIAIQRGFLRFFPPEVMGAHIGPSPAHTTGRQHRLSFRAAVALMGHLGVEADVSAMDASEQQDLSQWIALHKRLRPIIHGARIYQSSMNGIVSIAAWNHALQRGVLCVYVVAAQAITSCQRTQLPLLLPWLLNVRKIHIRPCEKNDTVLPPTWEDWKLGRIFTGEMLAKHGLPLPPMRPESAWILEFQASA